jgi:nicotinamidase-related amidase
MDVLVVIDVQNDFWSGGTLVVPDGDSVVPEIKRLIAASEQVVLTLDWHPAGHSSFASQHCRDRPGLDDLPQCPALGLAERGLIARGLAVDQSLRAARIEAQHLVAYRLAPDVPDACGIAARTPVIDRGQRQQPPGLAGMPACLGQPAKSRLIKIPAKSDCCPHGVSPLLLAARESEFA